MAIELTGDGTTGAPGQGAHVSAVVDRTAAFRRARRHSWLVRFLKFAFPLASLAMLGAYGFVLSLNSIGAPGGGKGKLQVAAIQVSRNGAVMVNPRYEGYNKDGSKFFVTAKQARPDIKQPDLVDLTAIDGTLTQSNDVKTRLIAARGFFDNKKQELDLFDQIQIASQSGLRAQLSKAKVFIKENRIVSTMPIAAQMEAGNIRANAMELLTKQRQATFTEGVAVRLNPKPKPKPKAAAAVPPANSAAGATAETPPPPKPARRKQASAGLGGNSNAPVDVVAMKLHIDDTTKLATFHDKVTATQGPSTLTAEQLEVYYTGNTDVAGGKSKDRSKAPKIAAGDGAKLKRIKALRHVVMTGEAGRRATSDEAEFDALSDTALLAGNVVLTQGANVVTGERLIMDRKADTALLTGDVVLKQGRNLLKGSRLYVNRKTAKSRLDRPALDGRAAGRITAKFYQAVKSKPAKMKKSQTDKQAGLAGAKTSPLQFKTDPNAPIDIDAARLDVDDNAKAAVFTGDVIAAQGAMILRTAKLIATYSGKTGLGLEPAGIGGAKAKQPDVTGKQEKQQAQLTRIEAREKVELTSKDGQQATGDWADFDVKANTVVMGGNVVLTQGKTVIAGEKLYIDMTTGKTRLIPKKGGPSLSSLAAGGKPSGSVAQNCPAGRICLVLTPGELQDAQKAKRAAANGWSAEEAKAKKRKKAAKPSAAGAQSNPGSGFSGSDVFNN